MAGTLGKLTLKIADSYQGIGSLPESLVGAAYASAQFAASPKVYRCDNSTDSTQISEETALATSASANSFSPFSTSVIPNSATLKVYDSTDGVWATNELTLEIGGIADFKSTGAKFIKFGSGSGRTAWKSTNNPTLAMPSLKYILFELDDGGQKDCFKVADTAEEIIGVTFTVDTAGSPTAAAKISNLKLVRKTPKYLDLTSTANGDTGVAITPTSNTTIVLPGYEFIVGFNNLPKRFHEYVQRKWGTGGLTHKVEVTAAGTAYITITSQYTSDSNFRQDGPTATTAPGTHYASDLPAVSGFAKRSIGTLPNDAGGNITTPSLYYLVFTVTAVTSYGAQNTAFSRLRVEEYGSPAGTITIPSGTTIKSASVILDGAVSGSGDRTLVLGNWSTGDLRNIVIPNGTTQYSKVFVDFDDLTFSADGQLGIAINNGGLACEQVSLYLNVS